ncbi:MAG: hypothetical protein C0483_18705 [Pirellula sp.]|nr:hypothetical protein [Pirellula sp.]
MYRGQYQLGYEAPIGIQCTDADLNPAAPDAAPTVTIYAADGSKPLENKAIPPKDRAQATGLFEHFVRLGSDFATGVYSVLYKWTTDGGAFTGRYVDYFEVLPGGHVDGTVLGLHYFDAGHAQFLVQQTDAGLIKAGKNPRV